MEQTAEQLAREYIRLGGRRLAVADDNKVSTRSWEPDSAEAAEFWKREIEPLDEARRDAVEIFLPSINDR